MIVIEEMDWIPAVGYPGYEVSAYGVICKLKKDGSREILMPYRDKKPDKSGHRWAYVTMYRNCQFKKVLVIDVIKSSWQPELERRKRQQVQNSGESVQYEPDKKKKRTTNPAEQEQKFKRMIDGYDPDKMSVNAYMKYLREQGFRFTSSRLSAELTKKKRQLEKNSEGLF